VSFYLCLLALICAPAPANTLDQLPVIGELPDPFVFGDGHRVSTPAEWSTRRSEIVELISQYEYGRVPPSPGNVVVDRPLKSGEVFEGTSSLFSLQLAFGPNHGLTTRVDCYTPTGASKSLPVILRFGLGGEHARAANERGYAFVCFEQTSLDPDTEGHDVLGPAQAAYPDYDWGSIAVWAWCASRVLDYLEAHDGFDATKAVITGHSRTGKAALLAGALDERFALVVPNGSGCGGAAMFRNPPKGVETLELIMRPSRFKSWFQADFGQFGDREDALPFDQHFLRALVAPRFILSTDAFEDQWCNPPGTQWAWRAAQPVFDFLGVPKNNLIHFRAGNHDQLSEDFSVLLNVADHVFHGKALEEDLQAPPFPDNLQPLWPVSGAPR